MGRLLLGAVARLVAGGAPSCFLGTGDFFRWLELRVLGSLSPLLGEGVLDWLSLFGDLRRLRLFAFSSMPSFPGSFVGPLGGFLEEVADWLSRLSSPKLLCDKCSDSASELARLTGFVFREDLGRRLEELSLVMLSTSMLFVRFIPRTGSRFRRSDSCFSPKGSLPSDFPRRILRRLLGRSGVSSAPRIFRILEGFSTESSEPGLLRLDRGMLSSRLEEPFCLSRTRLLSRCDEPRALLGLDRGFVSVSPLPLRRLSPLFRLL